MTILTRLLSLTVVVLLLATSQAQAQPPVKATNANPKANFIFAADVSHTMWYAAGNGNQRYENIRALALPGGALEFFKYDFNYGYFAYTAGRTFTGLPPNNNGGGDNAERHAQIVDDIASHQGLWPGTSANPNPVTSYDAVALKLTGTYVYNHCNYASGKGWEHWSCLEHTTRGGSVPIFTLTPFGDLPANRAAEKAAMEAILDYYSDAGNFPASGMFIPPLQTSSIGDTLTSTPCNPAHPDAPVGGPFAADGTENMTMCGPVPCFNGWHRAYIDQYVMTGIPLDTFDFYFELFHELGYWAWPRYIGAPTDAEVQTDFCDKLDTPLANIKTKLDDCLIPGTQSDNYWAGTGFSCNATDLAATMCNNSGPGGGSPFFTENTCVCFPNQAGCGLGSALPDDCSVNVAGVNVPEHMVAIPPNSESPAPAAATFAGSTLIRPYRQAEAMCYSERPIVGLSYQSATVETEPRFRTEFRDQPGNVLSAGAKCRANVIGFLTDGTGGSSGGVNNHAQMNRWVYKSRNRDGTFYPENHVFHATERGVGYDFAYVAYADAMSNTISGGVRPVAHNLARQELAAAALAGIFNRTQAGQYSAAPMVTDRFGTRIGVLSYEIPGRYAGSDYSKYLGRPGRLSWYQLNDDGTLGAKVFDTDWKSKTDAWVGGPVTAGFTARFFYGGAGSAVAFTSAVDGSSHNVGLSAQWSATHTTGGNGWTRFQSIAANTTDRNNDGIVNGADAHPALVWGTMIGVDNAKPVVVEAPIDPPGFGNVDFSNFATYTTGDEEGVQNRPRVVYVQANEFLHAIHAGTRSGGGAIGTQLGGLSQNREFDYDDSVARAGTEIWRYRPGFLRAMPNLGMANAMHYPLMNGSMVARDVKWRPAAATGLAKYATLLVMTQGASGRGLAVLDVSRPRANLGTQAAFVTTAATKKVIFDAALPAADVVSTSADPQIVDWPGTGANANRVALVMTSGWTANPTAGTPKKILVYQLSNVGGTNLQAGVTGTFTQIAVPAAAGATLASGARCVSFGKDFACYALDSTGVLWRARVAPATGLFIPGSVVNMNGLTAGGGSIDTSRVYNSLPAFYFSSDNALNIVFGSGNPDTLRQSESGDQIYRIRDATLSSGTAGTSQLGANVCKDASGDTSGIISLGSGERLLTNPVVSGGVVAWTTYAPPAGGDSCGVGTSRLYAMDFQTCADAVDGVTNLRPQPIDIGDGVPSSPTVLQRTGTVVAHTSKQIDAPSINGAATKVNTRGHLRKPIQRVYRLWWRRKAL